MISIAKQLASISAAGLSALALTGGKARAEIIDSGILNNSIIFSSNVAPSGPHISVASFLFNTFVSEGGPAFKFRATSNQNSAMRFSRNILMSRGGARNTSFGNRGEPFLFGTTWEAVASLGPSSLIVGHRSFGNISAYNSAFTDRYFLFQFVDNSVTEYGWIEASVSVGGGASAEAAQGPAITIVQYAYDDTGVQITAGQGAPSSSSPEPSSIAESGLAALILGAEGLRRWRKAQLP